MSRTTLPARRPTLTSEIVHDERTLTVCIGFDEEGQPREVFADGHKEGSQAQAFLNDACIVISIALQHGVSAAELSKSMSLVPAWHDGQEAQAWASPVGAILEALRAAEDGGWTPVGDIARRLVSRAEDRR